ncbi:MAG: pentapeptide repeat-containing protein [Nanoarchaeota archaeon]|nr:pentapeptide repeat-containing protein [Nanoarchaeota archaeon]
MKWDEFVKNVMNGKRYFKKVFLEQGFDLNGYEVFGELQAYLKCQDFEKDPVSMEKACIVRVKAEGLYFPYLKCLDANLEGTILRNAYLKQIDLRSSYLDGVDFGNSCLEGANLWNANLCRAKFVNANLLNVNFEKAFLKGAYFSNAYLENVKLNGANVRNANFENANLKNADFSNARLWFVNLDNANLENANFECADIAGVKNLERCLNIESARFYKTEMTKKEYNILKKVLVKKEQFILV